MTPDQWFEKYGECHQHPVNKAIHWIAVPWIFISIIGLLWTLPWPGFLPQRTLFNWATLILSGVVIYYFYLSLSLGVGMLIFSVFAATLVAVYDAFHSGVIWKTALVLFSLMWALQFAGHAIEGKKPAFFDDLKFLLIGPLWLMGFVYRGLKIRY